jgi:hypothetical protein
VKKNKALHAQKEEAINLEDIVRAQKLEEVIQNQKEYMRRAIHCLEYFEERHQTERIKFWANQCAEDLRRLS